MERIVALGSTRVDELGIDEDDINPMVAAGLTNLLSGNADELDERLVLFAEDAMVIESIVRLADVLSLEVVAEGIETTEQLRVIDRAGVDRVQGFLLARPMPADEAEALIFGELPIDLAALRRGDP